jgi:uncharacterized membrane protein
MTRIIGIALIALGAVLLYFGYNASQAPVEQLSETLTGRFTDRTMLYLVGGGVAAVLGLLLAVFGRR